MVAAQKLANENNELQTSRESGDAAGAASANQLPVFEVYENPNPPAAAATRPQLEVVEGGAGEALQIPASTNPSILSQPNETVVWLHGISPAVRNELKQIFIAQKDRPLELQIQTQASAEEIERQIEEQLALQVEGSYPALIREFVNKATLYSQQNKAPEINIVLMSKNTVEKSADEVLQAEYEKEKLRKISGDQISTTIYSEKGATSTDHARAGLNLTLGTPGAKAGIDPQALLKKSLAAQQDAQQDHPYVALILSSDVAGSVDAVSMKGYAHGKLEGKAAAVAPSDSGLDEKMAQRQLSLETYAAATRHPDAGKKTIGSLARQIENAVGEVDSELSDSSLAAQLNITDALRNLTRPEEEHPALKAAGARMEKVAAKAAELAGDVEKVTPAAILKELGRTPSGEARPIEPKRLAALAASRIKQLQKISENPDAEAALGQMAELVDERLLDALNRPEFAELAKGLDKVMEPVRRQLHIKSEAKTELQGLGAEELAAIDPKGTLKLDTKSQEVLRGLAQKLKADPALRAELAKNKEMAPLLEALEGADFENPLEMAKLAAQIAKLPATAREELSKTAPEFAEVAQQITQAVAMDALSQKLDGLNLAPEQREKLEAAMQNLAGAAGPEAVKAALEELSAVMAEFPPQVMQAAPQLQSLAETVRQAASEPAALDKLAAAHVDAKLDTIERVEAAHVHADMAARAEFKPEFKSESGASSFTAGTTTKFKPSDRPVEFSASTVSAMHAFQDAVRVSPAAADLPPTLQQQIEKISGADLSQPSAQQEVAKILHSAAADTAQSQPQTPVAQKLQEALKQTEIAALPLVQQIQGMNAPGGLNGTTNVGGAATVTVPSTAQTSGPQVSISQTMSSANLFRIATDPSVPESVRTQAFAFYQEQLGREKAAEMAKLAEARPQTPAQQLQQIRQDLQQLSGQAGNLQRHLHDQVLIQPAVIYDQASGTAPANTTHTSTVLASNSSDQSYQPTTNQQQDILAAMFAAGNGGLQIPSPANDSFAPQGQGFQSAGLPTFETVTSPVPDPSYIPTNNPTNVTPEAGPCDNCPLKGTFCGDACEGGGHTQPAIDKMAERMAEGEDIHFGGPVETVVHEDPSGVRQSGVEHIAADTSVGIGSPEQPAAGGSPHAGGDYSGNPDDCPYLKKLKEALLKKAPEESVTHSGVILDNPSGVEAQRLGQEAAENARQGNLNTDRNPAEPPPDIEVRPRGQTPQPQ